LHLKDVVWERPALISEETLELHVSLRPCEQGEVAFEIHAEPIGGEVSVYSRGIVTEKAAAAVPPAHDLPALRAQCTQGQWDGASCYAMFDRLGLRYGEGFQGLQALSTGAGVALAQIALPASQRAAADRYVLHPSLLDAAWQAA